MTGIANDETASLIRRLWLADFGDLRHHLKRLDGDARHARFGHAVSDEFLDSYVDTAHRLGTVLFGAFVESTLRGVAELRPLSFGLMPSAEGAITVEPAYQNRGLGKALMARLVEAAGNRGIPSLYMICLKDNFRMRRLARSVGARLSYEAGDIAGHLAPPPASPVSIVAEVMHESNDFMLAFFDHLRPRPDASRT